MQSAASVSSANSPAPSPTSMSGNPSVPVPSPSPGPRTPGIKGGYWPSSVGFPISAVDTSHFTHIYYAFVGIDPNTFQIVVTPSDDHLLPVFTTTLHSRNPPVKAMLSIGGAAFNASVFAEMASASATRSAFINSAGSQVRPGRVDLDWEFPKSKVEMQNLGSLFQEWRAAGDEYAWAMNRTPLLLTAAVYYLSRYVNNEYPVEVICDHVDFINAMCYDYRGPWDNCHWGPGCFIRDAESLYSTSYGIQSWLSSGVPPEKVAMRLPLYGRTWQLKDPRVNEIVSAAIELGPGEGTLMYKDVVDLNVANDASVVYDGITGSTYSYWGDNWIGYDDEWSVREKIGYALKYRLGGYFFWALGYHKDWSISQEASAACGI